MSTAPALSAAQSTHPFEAGLRLGTTSCLRCAGSGYLPQYRHVERGRCFRCGGAGALSGRQAA